MSSNAIESLFFWPPDSPPEGVSQQWIRPSISKISRICKVEKKNFIVGGKQQPNKSQSVLYILTYIQT